MPLNEESCFFNAGAFAVYDALFGRGDGTIFLDQVVCSGNESRLFDCRHRGVGVHSTSCTPGGDAGVVCPGKLNMPWCQTKYMGADLTGAVAAGPAGAAAAGPKFCALTEKNGTRHALQARVTPI